MSTVTDERFLRAVEDAIAIYYRDWWQRYGYDRLQDEAVATKMKKDRG